MGAAQAPGTAAGLATNTDRVVVGEWCTSGVATMGLSVETAGDFVRSCISEKDLRKLASAIELRLAELAAKERTKAAKRAAKK